MSRRRDGQTDKPRSTGLPAKVRIKQFMKKVFSIFELGMTQELGYQRHSGSFIVNSAEFLSTH